MCLRKGFRVSNSLGLATELGLESWIGCYVEEQMASGSVGAEGT